MPNNAKDFHEIRDLRYARWGERLWHASLYGLMAFVLFLVLLSFDNLPSFSQLEDPTNSLASPIYASKGELIGSYYIENRIPLDFKELPQNLIDALISTEDSRFYTHSGVDPEAILRVLTKTILLSDRSAGGGSTITQQLAKLLYSDRDFRGMTKFQKAVGLVTRKFKEMITAVKLERRYTKEEIIALYLNHFNFINGAYGIKAASEIYFGKDPSQLTIEESATLVGMLNNPSLFNPLRRPDRVKARRNIVLKKMERAGKLSSSQYEMLSKKPIDVTHFTPKNTVDGIAPYFRMELRKELLRILDRPECRDRDGKAYNIYSDGLKIYTTLDTAVQNCAEKAVEIHMSKLQKTFFQRWKGKDPWTFIKPKRADSMVRKEVEGEEEVRKERSVEEEQQFRAKMLWANVQNSERYEALRINYLEPVIEEIQKEEEFADIRLNDSDIERMIIEFRQPGEMARLVKIRYLSPEKSKIYKDLIKSDSWEKLRLRYNTLQELAKKEFSTPVKMKVFAYNKTSEKDTTLSPMDSIRYHRMILQTGMVGIDPTNGHVKAWVGGVNYKYFQYDHVTSERQVGSTFKPFIYATAISMMGFSPCFQVHDVPTTIAQGEGTFRLDGDWTPKNFDYYSGNYYTLKDALKKSVNTVSVFLMKQLGDTEPVRGLINSMGIDSSARRANGVLRIPNEPSICLGTADLSVLEMTGAYSTFANDGVFCKPSFITRIEDKNGKVIYQDVPLERRALSEDHNYVMMEMLKYVMTGSGGFGDVHSSFGGKTGTTNDNADGWFMGLTPSLVVGTWVGAEDRWVTFLDSQEGQGSYMAKPQFAKFLELLEKDPNTEFDYKNTFKKPNKELSIELDCYRYQLSGIENGSEQQKSENFEEGLQEDQPVGPPPAENDGFVE